MSKPQDLQISIPRASTATDSSSKPYTLYHIQLRLPLRDHTVAKRYSDFDSLNSELTSQVAAPPASLPPKSWLKRTVADAELTEQRRKGLEAYLRAILTTEDARWRQSSAWRSFLNLPQGSIDTSDKLPSSRGMDAAEWLESHREVKQQIHSARTLLKKRESANTAQEQHTYSAETKGALLKAATGIARLDDALKMFSSKTGASSIGDGEIRRRKDLLGASKKEVESLETVLRSMAVKSASAGSGAGGTDSAVASAGSKDALFQGSSGGGRPKAGRVLGAAKETERTRELDNDGVLQLQKQIMEEQDQDVLELGKAVSRMKEMGIMINEELVVQNQMLDLLDQDADRVDSKIGVAKKRIAKIN